MLLSLSSSLGADSLLWDSAGGVGILEGIDIGVSEHNTSTSYYATGEFYTLDGFIGRMVYQGEANKGLVFFNAGPIASGGGAGNYFYFTKVGSANRWRRIFLVVTLKAIKPRR